VSTLLEGVHVAVEAGGRGFADNALAWTPDGRSLVLFSGGDDADLVAVDAQTGEPRVLARNVERGAYIAVAPDGKSVAYVSRSTGNDEITIVPWDGGAEQNLTNDPSSDINPVWSPDGRFIAFLSDRGQPVRHYRLHTLDLISGEVRRIGEDAVLTRPVWIPTSVP